MKDFEAIYGRPKDLAELLGWIASNAQKLKPFPPRNHWATAGSETLREGVSMGLQQLGLLKHCLSLAGHYCAAAKYLDTRTLDEILGAALSARKLLENGLGALWLRGAEAEIAAHSDHPATQLDILEKTATPFIGIAATFLVYQSRVEAAMMRDRSAVKPSKGRAPRGEELRIVDKLKRWIRKNPGQFLPPDQDLHRQGLGKLSTIKAAISSSQELSALRRPRSSPSISAATGDVAPWIDNRAGPSLVRTSLDLPEDPEELREKLARSRRYPADQEAVRKELAAIPEAELARLVIEQQEDIYRDIRPRKKPRKRD